MEARNQLVVMPTEAQFSKYFEIALAHAVESNRCLGLLIFEIDVHMEYTSPERKRQTNNVASQVTDFNLYLKGENEHSPDKTGTPLLNIVAERIRCHISAKDMVAYFGRNTFAILLAAPKSMATVALASEKIMESLVAPISLKKGAKCIVEASIGIAIYPDNGTKADTLFSVAQTAMNESKASGKNICTLYKGQTLERAEFMPWASLDYDHLTGIPEIDDQHRRLAQLINSLHEAIKDSTKKNRQHAFAKYDELISFTELHFAAEARLMDKIEYPLMSSHKSAHKFLLNELSALRGRIIEGGELYAFQVLKDWLVAHIESDDKQMGEFLALSKSERKVAAKKFTKAELKKKPFRAKNGSKMIKCSFTFPEVDYRKIFEIQKNCFDLGVHVKKTEILRSGLYLLANANHEQLVEILGKIEKIKTGRPLGVE